MKSLYRLAELPAVYGAIQWFFGEAPARRRFVREILRPRPGDSLLDLGCGPAALLHYLPEQVAYTGVDENPRYLDAAARKYGARGRFVEKRLGVGRRLELGAGRFDIVSAIAVLHHLDAADASALVELARHYLAPGGRFVTIDPVLYDGQPLVSRLSVSADRGRHVRCGQAYLDLLTPYFPNVETRLLTDLARLPYAHFAMVAAPGPAAQ